MNTLIQSLSIPKARNSTLLLLLERVEECQTKRTQTRIQHHSQRSHSLIRSNMDTDTNEDTNDANASDSTIWTVPGRQPVTTNIWQSKKLQMTPNNEMKAMKLIKKMKNLQPFFESQPIELQWAMYNKSKSMIGFQKDSSRKTDSLINQNNTMSQDKHNINTEGRPTEKKTIR